LILSEDFQLLCLDHFAQADPLRESFAELYQQYHQQQARLQKLINVEKHSEDKQKLYEYQIKEINDLNLRIDEEHELESEREILSNAQDILDHSLEFHQALFESENALYDQISFYSLYYEKFDQENHLLKEMSELLKSVLTQMEEMNQISRRIPQEIFLDADRLSEVEQRLKDIYQLKTKYHRSIPEIIQFKEEMEKFVNEKSSLKDQIQNLSEDQDRLADQLIEKANRLTEIRERSALEFAKEIETNLQDLAIPSAQVKIKVDKLEETHNDKKKIVSGFRESGQDQVSVLFNANKGGDLQLLKHAASGGELSRLLLVIKKILASNLPPQSIVFDEIDSGIGGKTADMLGAYIYKISKYHQIICITHLPQVASYADRQYKIEKLDDLEKTEIQVKVLEDNDRLNEIARMLSGSLSQNALNHAQELIDKRKN
jgi:DNA repair protein RecN (Recombination protein N)